MRKSQLPSRPSLEQYKKQAKELAKAYSSSDAKAIKRIQAHLPRMGTLSEETLASGKFTLADSQLVIAREHGFPSWAKFKEEIVARTDTDAEPPIHHHINDSLFREAIDLLDAGNVAELDRHLEKHPELLANATSFSQTSFLHGTQPSQYFHQPKLLWFIAENPTRNGNLPANIVEITKLIIDKQRVHSSATLQEDVNYTLGLVVSSEVTRGTKARSDLIDILVKNGADVNCADAALIHRELDAVQALLDHGADMTLAIAASMGFMDELRHLFDDSDEDTRLMALGSAAINGQADTCRFLIDQGVSPNQLNSKKCHPHCTPLHNAVNGGSLEVVRILLKAGADTTVKDKLHEADALEWAQYLDRGDIARLIEDTRSAEPGYKPK